MKEPQICPVCGGEMPIMPDKTKMQDKRIWERMGRELAALRDLIGCIITEPEYQAVMDRQTWNKLCIAQERVDTVRGKAEDRMRAAIPGLHLDTFYPRNRKVLELSIAGFRAEVGGEAAGE